MGVNREVRNLLAIDTSSEAQVVGVWTDGELVESFEQVGRDHSRLILPSVEATLARAKLDKGDLDGIVYGRGPGSFTGVRITVGVVQGLGFGLGIPVTGVSTLACLAQEEFHNAGAQHVVVALHAREDEVYFGSYSAEGGLMKLNGKEGVLAAAQVPGQSFASCHGVGSGWRLRDQLVPALQADVLQIREEAWPQARSLIELGLHAFEQNSVQTAQEAQPEYLREQVAKKQGPA